MIWVLLLKKPGWLFANIREWLLLPTSFFIVTICGGIDCWYDHTCRDAGTGGHWGQMPPKFYKVPLFHEKVPFFQCGLCAIVPFYLFSFLELKNMIAVVSLDKQFTCASAYMHGESNKSYTLKVRFKFIPQYTQSFRRGKRLTFSSNLTPPFHYLQHNLEKITTRKHKPTSATLKHARFSNKKLIQQRVPFFPRKFPWKLMTPPSQICFRRPCTHLPGIILRT